MSGKITTYNPKEVVIAAGNHIVTGVDEDSFVTIEANGDGITKKVGCYGDVARSVSPDGTYNVKIALLQTSESNAFFSQMADKDRDTGDGMFPLLIKDLKGGEVFSTEAAWVNKKASLTRGKESNTREWEISTGDATLSEGG